LPTIDNTDTHQNYELHYFYSSSSVYCHYDSTQSSGDDATVQAWFGT